MGALGEVAKPFADRFQRRGGFGYHPLNGGARWKSPDLLQIGFQRRGGFGYHPSMRRSVKLKPDLLQIGFQRKEVGCIAMGRSVIKPDLLQIGFQQRRDSDTIPQWGARLKSKHFAIEFQQRKGFGYHPSMRRSVKLKPDLLRSGFSGEEGFGYHPSMGRSVEIKPDLLQIGFQRKEVRIPSLNGALGGN